SATDSAIVESMKILKNYRENGITPEELDYTKKSMVSSDALNYETPFDKAAFLNKVIEYNLDKNFAMKQAEIVNSMTKEQIDALAKLYLHPDNMIIMIAGDEYVIKEKLEKLGYGKVQVLDSDGKGTYKINKNHE
ncbi:MAG: insulinase family protein, partial [Bacteroidia bacterium]|nr:insulinase family protein [Bacteroidia bacterium]